MKKIINLAILVVATSFLSCSQGEDDKASSNAPVTVKEIQKTPQMLEFEDSFRGITMRMAESPEARTRELALITAKCKLYLESNQVAYDKNANEGDVIRTALRFHATKIQELRTLKK
ncbi:hypothetical protein [Flavobacterium caeni]|nr:hypothetical protein [Flavobacterium caeni]